MHSSFNSFDFKVERRPAIYRSVRDGLGCGSIGAGDSAIR